MSKEIKCADHLEGKSSRVVIFPKHCDFLKERTKSPLFILGFTGVGMIGTILTNEMINQLKMEQVGYVLSEDLPPITLFYDGVLKHPFRLYWSAKFNLVLSICEVPFNQGSYRDLARTLMEWALIQNISDVICLQGMTDNNIIRDGPVEVYAAGEKEILAKIQKQGIQIPPRGLIMGAEAAILNECLNNQLNGVVFLTPANPQIPNPEGAAAILEKISKIYNIPIDLTSLYEQANTIKQNLLELAKKTNDIHQQAPIPARDIYT
ncbi:MAG: proteasome assembly chaperone family protein [Promethearchaeota archaeon]